MGAVRVYLDNQDFSRLYRPQNKHLQEIAAELLELSDSGTATFHYSYWNIFEFLQHAEPRYLADRRDRAKFLKRLCGANALPYFQDTLAGERPVPGIWLPISIIRNATINLRARMDAKLDQRKANRHMRRMTHSRRAWRAAVDKTFRGETFEKRAQWEMGLTDEFVAVAPISRLFRGEISEEEFKNLLGGMFCDPEFFFETWLVKEKQDNPIRTQSIEIGEKWIKTVISLRESTLKYSDLRTASLRHRRQFYDNLRSSSITHEMKKRLSDEFPKIPPPVNIDDILKSTAPDKRLRYLECYLKFHLAQPQREPVDVVDLMHLFHAREVDLIRCDRAIFSIMKNCPHLQTERMVGTIFELPNRIRKAATNQ